MRTKLNRTAALTIACLLPMLPLLSGCQTVFSATVTVTEIVDSTMKNWATLSKAGKTTPDIDAKVIAAHAHYQEAARVAVIALKAYKESGNESQYVATLTALKAAVSPIIELIVPLLTADQSNNLKAKLIKANTP